MDDIPIRAVEISDAANGVIRIPSRSSAAGEKIGGFHQLQSIDLADRGLPARFRGNRKKANLMSALGKLLPYFKRSIKRAATEHYIVIEQKNF